MDYTAIYYDKNFKVIYCEILKNRISSTVKAEADANKPDKCRKVVVIEGNKISESEKISTLIYVYKGGASTRYERQVLKLAIIQLKHGWKSKEVENWVSETLKRFRNYYKSEQIK
jgi:hypothetical protein